MKSLAVGSTLALFLLSLPMPPATHAQTPGPSASGSFRFVLEDELPKSLEFDATTDEKGVTTGVMTFTDQARIPDVDDPEDPPRDAPPEFALRAQFDSLTIEGNRALMNGTVVDSTHQTYLKSYVQLLVEDNKEGPDRLTWVFCRSRPGEWIPSDGEWEDDQGAFLRWWATDAERDDDVGIPSPELLPRDVRSCQVHPLSVYFLADLPKWDGDIIVRP